MFFRLVDKQSDTVMTERPAGTWNVTQTFFYYCKDGKDLPGPTTGTTPGTSVTAVTDTSGPDIAGTATPSEPIGGGAWAAIGIAIAFVVSVGFGIAIRFRENITKFVSDAVCTQFVLSKLGRPRVSGASPPTGASETMIQQQQKQDQQQQQQTLMWFN